MPRPLKSLLTPHPSCWTLPPFLPPLYHSLASHPVHFPPGLEPTLTLKNNQGIYCTTTTSLGGTLLYLRSQGHLLTVMPLHHIDLREPRTELSIDANVRDIYQVQLEGKGDRLVGGRCVGDGGGCVVQVVAQDGGQVYMKGVRVSRG